ncbi:MAG: hypothetical protein CMM30_02145 [Rhodospirillaceae bacterium]|nr:hypothetical protein [Rhodospirillaceae bacterium]
MKSTLKFLDLEFPEQLIVWAMRVWTRIGDEEASLHYILRDGLSKAGATNAYIDFDSTMTILNETSLLPYRTGCPDGCCENFQHLCAIEKIFLMTVSRLQSSSSIRVFHTNLNRFITQKGMHLVDEPIKQLADSLYKSNIRLPIQDWDLEFDIEYSGENMPQHRTFH